MSAVKPDPHAEIALSPEVLPSEADPEAWGDRDEDGHSPQLPGRAQSEEAPTDPAADPAIEPVGTAAVDTSTSETLEGTRRNGLLGLLWERLGTVFGRVPVREPPTVPLPPVRDLAIFGPMGSGKTASIVAFDQACALGRTGANQLTFQAGDERTQELIRHGVDTLTEHDRFFRATTDVRTYPFTLRGRIPGRGARLPRSFELGGAIWDGPGGGLFPPKGQPVHPSRATLLQRGRSAEVLVFCFDVNQRWHELLAWRLHDALRGMSSDGVLRARRILVLLNKVDLLAHRLASHLRRTACDPLTRRICARDVAQRIDPLSQAIEVLGRPQLTRFRSYMAPDSSFAVGLCSTSGFTPEGEILLNEAGRPVRRDAGEHLDNSAFLNLWQPFGVQDALLYVAAGEVAGQVSLVRDDDLADHPRPAHDVALSF